jgi:hypothetical protein
MPSFHHGGRALKMVKNAHGKNILLRAKQDICSKNHT